MRQGSREDKVREFMATAKQPCDVKEPDETLLEFRYSLILEEVRELGEEIAYAMAESKFKDGIPNKVKVRMLKEMADVQYVLSGLAVTLGLPLEEAFNRVHASNMSKFGPDGKAIFNAAGKVLKGPNYAPARVGDLIGAEED